MHKTKLLIYALLIMGLFNSCASIKKHRHNILVGTCVVAGSVAGLAYAFKNDGDHQLDGRETTLLGGFFGGSIGLGIEWMFFEKDENQNILKEIGQNDSESIEKYSPDLLLTNHTVETDVTWVPYLEGPETGRSSFTGTKTPPVSKAKDGRI